MRARVTAASVAIVGVALVIGALGLVALLRRSLTDQVRTAASLRAEDAAEALAAGSTPMQVTRGGDEVLLQVVDSSGDVLAASASVRGREPVRSLQPGANETAVGGTPVDREEFLVVARRARFDGAEVVLLVGRPLDAVSEATRVVAGLLFVGVPVLLALVGATTWWVAGRVLSPVDAVRSEVEAISAGQLHRRVPVRPRDDEISRLARTMNEMLGRLEHSQIAQRRFVSDASHELRSPLASIRQHAEVGIAHPDTTTADEVAAPVLEEALRAQNLVEDLLLLARADEGTPQAARRPVDTDDLVFAEAARLRAGTTLRVDTRRVSAGRVLGDAAHLARLLRNLADNAARHARSTITFALTQADGRVVLTVEDDGPGIAAEQRQRVLERFVRLDEARARHDGGAGLGLAIVAEITRSHNGTVLVAEADSGGALITIDLPAATDDRIDSL